MADVPTPKEVADKCFAIYGFDEPPPILSRQLVRAIEEERARVRKALLACLHLTLAYRPEEFNLVAQAIAQVASDLGIDLKVEWQIGVQGNATDPVNQE